MTWQTNTVDSGASTEGPEHHQPVPSQYKGGGPTVKGIQRAWFGGGGGRGSIFGFLPWFLLGIYPAGMVSYLKEVINGWDHLMHAIELGSKVEVYSKNKKKGNFFVKWVAVQQTCTEQWQGQPMGEWVILKGCLQQTKNSWWSPRGKREKSY